jgi:hypothetical protein
MKPFVVIVLAALAVVALAMIVTIPLVYDQWVSHDVQVRCIAARGNYQHPPGDFAGCLVQPFDPVKGSVKKP